MSDDCTFCAIVAGEADAHEVYRDEDAVGFLDVNPAARGHALVVPTAHREGLPDMDDGEACALFAAVRRVAIAQRAALAADGVSVFQSTGAAAGQDVFHVHAHVIPRFEDDGIRFAPPRSRLSAAEGDEIATAISGSLP